MATSKEYILNALEKNRAPLLHEPNKAYFVINGERKDLTSDLNAVKIYLLYLKQKGNKNYILNLFEEMISSQDTINEEILDYLLEKCRETYKDFNFNKYAHYTKNINNLEWALKNNCKIKRLIFFRKGMDINRIVVLIKKYNAYIGNIPFDRLPYESIEDKEELNYL